MKVTRRRELNLSSLYVKIYFSLDPHAGKNNWKINDLEENISRAKCRHFISLSLILLLDFGIRHRPDNKFDFRFSALLFFVKLLKRNEQTRGLMSESDSLADHPETSPHLQPFPSSERLSDAHFRLLFYLHGPSRSACWLSRSQYNLDHHQGNNALLFPTVSGYISTSALLFNPLWQAGIFCILYFCVLYGQHYFGFLSCWETKIHQGCFHVRLARD